MKHHTLVSSLTAAALAALCAFTPVSAKDKDKDADKKSATQAQIGRASCRERV